jgi:hypothetical protein
VEFDHPDKELPYSVTVACCAVAADEPQTDHP